jgi:hypothetical protein
VTKVASADSNGFNASSVSNLDATAMKMTTATTTTTAEGTQQNEFEKHDAPVRPVAARPVSEATSSPQRTASGHSIAPFAGSTAEGRSLLRAVGLQHHFVGSPRR